MTKKTKTVAFAAGAAIVVLLAAWACGAFSGGEGSTAGQISFSTGEVKRGAVYSTISASGTIEPEELVDVGSQVSGKIVAFGIDSAGAEVDYCSVVTNGMVLARIDDVTYLADLEVAQAQKGRATAAVTSARASVNKAKVALDHARKDWERAQRIGVGIALSQSDFDSYQAAYESAEAELLVAEASVSTAEAQLVEAGASVDKAERNLGYCTIVSPVDGVVVDRRVNLGQTVVSSMSVSSLFLVAKDLAHVRIWAAVNEADIGSVKEGQEVRFTVDTIPGRTFSGRVRRVRLNATVTSNVVTYTVEIDTDNLDGSLLPYLTANVEFIVDKVEDALVVPARALRWSPDGVASATPAKGEEGVVWLPPQKQGEGPVPVRVKVLLSTGSDAAIEPLDGAVALGTRVITNESEALSRPEAESGKENASNNPLMPNMPKRPKGSGGPH